MFSERGVNSPATHLDQHPGTARVRAALLAHGLTDRVVTLPESARTALAAASALGCEVAHIVNSLVFRLETSDRALLVLASGARRVDVGMLAHWAGEPVGKANADFVRERTGFVIGGVAPVGHTQAPICVIERSVLGYDKLWAAAGHPHAVFHLTPTELLRITQAPVVDAVSPAPNRQP